MLCVFDYETCRGFPYRDNLDSADLDLHSDLGLVTDLDGLAYVDEAGANGDEEFIEAHHLLHQDGVHALSVRGRILA